MALTKHRQDWNTFFKTVSGKKLILWGAGYRAAQFINHNRKLDVAYICDNDPAKAGKFLMNIPIVNLSRLTNENPDDFVILATHGQIQDVLQSDAVSTKKHNLFILDALNSEGEYTTYFFDHYNELLATVDMLNDDLSKRTLLKIAEYKQSGINDWSAIYTPYEYYLLEMYEHYICHDEVIIDGGGYIGDTIQKFIEFFGSTLKRAYSFEPAPACMKQLTDVVASNPQYDLIVKPYGLSDKNETVEFVFQKNAWAGSHLKDRRILDNESKYDNESMFIEVRALDHIIPENEKITFIKMDVEGAEFKSILGAKGLIQKWKPRLAIAIYHSAHDYIQIPKLIRGIVPEYKLFIRHHTTNGADTVLYAFI